MLIQIYLVVTTRCLKNEGGGENLKLLRAHVFYCKIVVFVVWIEELWYVQLTHFNVFGKICETREHNNSMQCSSIEHRTSTCNEIEHQTNIHVMLILSWTHNSLTTNLSNGVTLNIPYGWNTTLMHAGPQLRTTIQMQWTCRELADQQHMQFHNTFIFQTSTSNTLIRSDRV